MSEQAATGQVVVNTTELETLLADTGYLVGAVLAYADEHRDVERAAKATAWTAAARALLDTAVEVERSNLFAHLSPDGKRWGNTHDEHSVHMNCCHALWVER